jgi:membrane protease YdiL (CAAX protease family)
VSEGAQPVNAWIVARAIVSGLLIAFAGIAPWAWLAPINARIHPEWPWAGAIVVLWLLTMIWWLNGAGPPRSWRAFRNAALRLWRPPPGAWSGEGLVGTLGLMAVIVSIYVFWIVASLGQPTPDLSEYPTTAILVSVWIVGALVSGVVEEVAYRGYMQSQLERFGPTVAIGVTSVVFALSHLTHGLQALLLMAPGYIMASVLYGLLAYRTGSILPGMALHVTGDAAHTFFAVLGGDASLLVTSAR